jgi:hypothetical protein
MAASMPSSRVWIAASWYVTGLYGSTDLPLPISSS